MSPLLNVNTKQELQDEFDDIDDYMEEQYLEERDRNAMFSGWSISLATHALVALVLTFVVVAARLVNNVPPTRAVMIDTIELPDMTEPDLRELENVDIVIVHEEKVNDQKTIITDLDIDMPEVDIQTQDPDNCQDAKGRLEAKSDLETGSTGAFMAIGAAGGGKGAFGRVKGGDNRRIGKAYGPNGKKAKSAVDAALRWLKRHQSDNGQWDSDNYFFNCHLDGPKCEPGKNRGGADEAITGYALLCFLGAGYDHKVPSQYQRTIIKAIDWVLQNQDAEGLIGKRNYEHPVCTMALAEAYAMTMDPKLRGPTQKAVDVILNRQVKSPEGDEAYAGLGWDYVSPKITRMDSSVSGWNVMALKSAKAGGLDVDNSLEGAKKWLEGAWAAANPNHKNLDPYAKSVFPYTWNGSSGATKKDHLSFVGALCGVFLGYNADDVLLATMANDMTERWFTTGKYKDNSYCLYYSTLAAFQVGGKHWEETWGNEKTGYVPWLIDTQFSNGGCQDGTWLHDKESWHGWDTSPVLTHVYKTLALEVAFRYMPVAIK